MHWSASRHVINPQHGAKIITSSLVHLARNVIAGIDWNRCHQDSELGKLINRSVSFTVEWARENYPPVRNLGNTCASRHSWSCFTESAFSFNYSSPSTVPTVVAIGQELVSEQSANQRHDQPAGQPLRKQNAASPHLQWTMHEIIRYSTSKKNVLNCTG